jgi:hypothetical protein
MRSLKSIIGNLKVTEKQAMRLNVAKSIRISPYLEKCCLRASANVSYENAARDVLYYTGMKISAKTQQRLVHGHEFPEDELTENIQEISVDGGKVRLRTETEGEPCVWRDYKAICINGAERKAWFGDNEALIDWINQQPLSDSLYCLGDGHPGIWNIISQFLPLGEKIEILDWFHLVENLYKTGASKTILKQAKELLWYGKVAETLQLISSIKTHQSQNFCKYLATHRHRIINYFYYQAELVSSIASGAVESTVKQIARRLKISGAQWNSDNVPQVLKHRCAYLNNHF